MTHVSSHLFNWLQWKKQIALMKILESTKKYRNKYAEKDSQFEGEPVLDAHFSWLDRSDSDRATRKKPQFFTFTFTFETIQTKNNHEQKLLSIFSSRKKN